MRLTYEGNNYDFDLEEITLLQAKTIKTHLQLTLKGLEDGLADGDPDALRAIFWLMLENSGTHINLIDVDFKIVKFANALQDATEREAKEAEAAKKTAGKAKAPSAKVNVPTT